MTIVTIPKTLRREEELVLIPRKEYEALVALRKVREFLPTTVHKKALKRALRNLRTGQTLSYNEFAKGLGFTH